jgi:hypothetical protein
VQMISAWDMSFRGLAHERRQRIKLTQILLTERFFITTTIYVVSESARLQTRDLFCAAQYGR